MAELFETAKRELHGLPEDSPKAPALRALVREREGLTVFLYPPSTPMDNNASQRTRRAPANSRKVSFGSHGETGARLGIAAELGVAVGTVKAWRSKGWLRATAYDDKPHYLYAPRGADPPKKYRWKTGR